MQNLRIRRGNINMTQKEFAAAVGVKQSTVSLWESGIIFPTADKLPAIARVLHCSIDELFSNEEKKEAG